MESVNNCDSVINERQRKLEELKSFLSEVEEKLLSITNDLKWDYNKLQEEVPSTMVTCSINSQHRVPISSIKSHEERCSWRQRGYQDDDKPFSIHSGQGSCITLDAELLNKITAEVSPADDKTCKAVPETSANLDQNFSREEKLAIYDYVIANTKSQNTYSDLCLQPLEKKEEKKEMTSWEIAAALRDAKRRRASYRNKVHTNRKTHTEILREVIEVQMDILKDKMLSSPKEDKTDHRSRKKSKNSKHERDDKKYSNHDSHGKDKEERKRSRKHDRHSDRRDRRSNKSPEDVGSDHNSRSRFTDKHRKWKKYEGRSHYRRSSKYQF